MSSFIVKFRGAPKFGGDGKTLDDAIDLDPWQSPPAPLGGGATLDDAIDLDPSQSRSDSDGEGDAAVAPPADASAPPSPMAEDDAAPPAPPAAPQGGVDRRAYDCALGDRGVPADIMGRINFTDVVRVCEEESNAVADSRVILHNGNRVQFHLDETPSGQALLQRVLNRRNPNDQGRLYGAVWGNLMDSLRLKIGDMLCTPKFGLTAPQASAMVFETCAIIKQDARMMAQAPHVDFLKGVQCVVACSNGVKPTLVYTGDYMTTADMMAINPPTHSQRESAMYLHGLDDPEEVQQCFATLACKPRVYMDPHMQPSAPRDLRPGEFSCLCGPIIHAGPSTPAGVEPRIVMFLTAKFPTDPSYDPDSQITAPHAALSVRSARMAVRRALEYPEYEPWTMATNPYVKDALLDVYLGTKPENKDDGFPDEEETVNILRNLKTEKADA